MRIDRKRSSLNRN